MVEPNTATHIQDRFNVAHHLLGAAVGRPDRMDLVDLSLVVLHHPNGKHAADLTDELFNHCLANYHSIVVHVDSSFALRLSNALRARRASLRRPGCAANCTIAE